MEPGLAELIEQNRQLIDMLRQQQEFVITNMGVTANQVVRENFAPIVQQPYVVKMTAATVENFDGETGNVKTKAVMFLRQITDLGRVNGWPEEQKLPLALANLRGAARHWQLSQGNNLETWQQFEREFRATFIGELSTSERWTKMKRCIQKKDQTIDNYFMKLN